MCFTFGKINMNQFLLLASPMVIVLASCATHTDTVLQRTMTAREESPLVYEWSAGGAKVATLAVSWVDDDHPDNEPLHGEITKMRFRTDNSVIDIPAEVFSKWWWPGLDDLTLRHPSKNTFVIEFLGGDGAGTYSASIEIQDGTVSSYRPVRVPEPKPWQ